MSNHEPTPPVTAASPEIGRATKFELASPGQPGAANIASALERNRAFAAPGGDHDIARCIRMRLETRCARAEQSLVTSAFA